MAHKKYLLLNWAFVSGLLLLLCNDHHWKWTYSNYLTGKLSDFAGLLILPLLLAYLLPKQQRKWAVYISGLFFLFWKSPYSESFIEAYNQLAPIPISRVVDYSDLMALAILPLAGYLIQFIDRWLFLHLPGKFVSTTALVTITLFAFVATSPPPNFHYSYNYGQGNVHFHRADYKLKMPKAVILDKLDRLGLQVEIDTVLINKNWSSPYTPVNYEHAQYYLIREMIIDDDTLKNIKFGLRPLSGDKTRIYLNALTTSSPVDSIQVERQLSKVYKKLLKKEVIRSLRN